MSGLCRYKDALGEPGKGVHAVRLGNVAVLDVLATAAAAFLIGRVSGWSFIFVFLILMVIAVALHELFCVNTRLNSWLFGRPFKVGA